MKFLGGARVEVELTTLESEEHPTIYHHLLATDAEVKVSKKALQDESTMLLAAGTDTAGNACMIGTVHLLSNRALKDTWFRN
ncbi:uncharacterized protein LACBIDRAFT_303048 [Laccaria bicolor S238N-H82]|uniref:Predicted protein n=1 Tax=Laccaria bicolor (strain S238N-H82 / ATCC MYA-4686) TaxID=486041 RepID=B0DIU6_LACBS|nr:uncharacterized protein LACBIDRAFT_303048 [Laccaria bicolor S238N-H82]EDR05403.1 predicted protein [Laccaria bicolor S238N-H82]|eukprot:XP_001883961.1 predicted protein [Laccaria bicolor S238N-H82]